MEKSRNLNKNYVLLPITLLIFVTRSINLTVIRKLNTKSMPSQPLNPHEHPSYCGRDAPLEWKAFAFHSSWELETTFLAVPVFFFLIKKLSPTVI